MKQRCLRNLLFANIEVNVSVVLFLVFLKSCSTKFNSGPSLFLQSAAIEFCRQANQPKHSNILIAKYEQKFAYCVIRTDLRQGSRIADEVSNRNMCSAGIPRTFKMTDQDIFAIFSMEIYML